MEKWIVRQDNEFTPLKWGQEVYSVEKSTKPVPCKSYAHDKTSCLLVAEEVTLKIPIVVTAKGKVTKQTKKVKGTWTGNSVFNEK